MDFINYFGEVFTVWAFGLLLLGTIFGLILGATPGLSPTMAVALAIPFTFKLEPAHGLILLGALYTSTVAGGAVSAILLKIPGAPANIATTLDGHTMAKNGQAKRALQLSFFASLFGGVFGILLLIFMTPILAEWALVFGPSESFWVAILGVTIIGTLGGGSVVKGLLAGCIGMWVSTIGFDDILGTQRFIFHPSLSGGINIIPALIGLFAIPQVISMFAKGRVHDNLEVIQQDQSAQRSFVAFSLFVGTFVILAVVGTMFFGLFGVLFAALFVAFVEFIQREYGSLGNAIAEVLSRYRALSIGTAVGSIIGLIPGVGGQIAGLVAYDQARNFSPEREKFGTGHSEGIIAAESANNAMVGPSLVPLLTLSIPGSPTAAVLLGGLIIHGIFPGPNIFKFHPEVVWPFINSMLIGQVLMCIFGLMIAGLAAKIARVPRNVMAAVVLALAVFGSYSVQLSMNDVFIMLVLGTGMYFLERYGYSAAPLVLGLILGPIAEGNFVEGAMIANAQNGIMPYFFTGTLNLVLIGIVLTSIIYSAWLEIKNKKTSEVTT